MFPFCSINNKKVRKRTCVSVYAFFFLYFFCKDNSKRVNGLFLHMSGCMFSEPLETKALGIFGRREKAWDVTTSPDVLWNLFIFYFFP